MWILVKTGVGPLMMWQIFLIPFFRIKILYLWHSRTRNGQVRGVSGLRRREWGGLPSPTRLQLVRKSPHGADYRGKSSLGRRPGWRTRCSIRLRLCGASEEERHRHAPNTLVRALWAMKCRSNGSFKILSLCSFDSSTSPSWTQFSRSFSEKM